MADAFASGGVPQPPAKKCKRTRVSSELSGAHPTAEEAPPSAVADLIIPPELVPIKKAFTATIKVSDNFDEHEFKVAIAYTAYAEWRCTKSVPELTQMQQRHMCIVFQKRRCFRGRRTKPSVPRGSAVHAAESVLPHYAAACV